MFMQKYCVGFPCFWENEKGEHPAPWTIVSYNDIKKGVWRPVDRSLKVSR